AQDDDLPIKMASAEQLLRSLQLAHRGSSVRLLPTTLTHSPALFAPEPPETITLDGYAASHRAVREMKADGLLPEDTKVRSSKYLNNV
ncbi:hypothetical protein VSR83_42060, partial [Paraburkholderia unamae]